MTLAELVAEQTEQAEDDVGRGGGVGSDQRGIGPPPRLTIVHRGVMSGR